MFPTIKVWINNSLVLVLETLENTEFVDDALTQKKLKNGVTNRKYVLVSPLYTFKVLDRIKKWNY